MAQRKVMVIGLDAMTMDLLGPWAQAGDLPNLSAVMRDGVSARLQSTLPVISPAAWSTFATGTNPGKHGVIDFCQLSADSYDAKFMNATHRRGKSFWEIAGAAGVRGGVINVPITYPPTPYNGFLVSGVLSPGVVRGMTSPPGIFDDLLAASPDYAVDVDVVDSAGRDVRLLFLDRAVATTKARLDAAVGLYRQHQPALFCVVFMAADRICHYFWHYMAAAEKTAPDTDLQRRLAGAIHEVYAALDEAVGVLLAEAGDDTDVLILSDHGAGPLTAGLNLRKVLADVGLLVESAPSLAGRLSKWGIETFARIAPTSLKSKIKARFGGLAQRAAGVVACSGIDFARTRAYPTGDSAGVFVNLQSRQEGGIVAPGDPYEAVRDEVIAVLSNLTGPDGRKVARRVYRREEVFQGPCAERLPDVIMAQQDYQYATTLVSDAGADETFYPLPDPGAKGLHRHGDHRPDGILLARGPHIRQAELADPQIADVPATVLALLGVPIPEDFDGRVLAEMLTDDIELPGTAAAASEDDGLGQEVLSADEAEAVRDRLKGLGYL